MMDNQSYQQREIAGTLPYQVRQNQKGGEENADITGSLQKFPEIRTHVN